MAIQKPNKSSENCNFMQWTVLFYETNAGERVVENFIKNQQSQAKGKISHLIDLLEKHGSILGMPHAKHLGTNLYELRVRGKEEIRILYGFKKRTIYLLHAFKKQTQKTPNKEIETALQRLQILIDKI